MRSPACHTASLESVWDWRGSMLDQSPVSLGRRVQEVQLPTVAEVHVDPHGRHGSKLRTVRMMSIPLKCSWSFSSKIWWP